MNRTPLQESIRHWERLRDCTTVKAILDEGVGANRCALCQTYPWYLGCLGCPVKNETGIRGCRNTPYTEAYRYAKCRGREVGFDVRVWVKLAQAELDFLRSLKEPDTETYDA